MTSQFAARQLAFLFPAKNIPPRLGFLNGLLLLPIAIAARPELGGSTAPLIGNALMLGCAISLVQGTMLAGFQRVVHPALSGVIVATNVPLFFLIEDIWVGKLPSVTSVAVVGAIVCVIFVRAVTKDKRYAAPSGA